MLVTISKQDAHASKLMGADTVKLCEMQGFKPRLENENQSRVEANIYGFKAEFAVARLLDLDPPTLNVVTDGGVDLWFDDMSIDVKFTNQEFGPLIFDTITKFKAQLAVLVGRTEDPNVMRVNGWIDRKTFKHKATSHDFGYGDRLVMGVEELLPIEQLWRKFMEHKFKGE
jgi:hypothetical protein